MPSQTAPPIYIVAPPPNFVKGLPQGKSFSDSNLTILPTVFWRPLETEQVLLDT